MKVYRTLTIVVITIFGISILSTGVIDTAAQDTIAPTLSLVAEYNPGILVDGDYGDWNMANEGYFDIFGYDDGTTTTFQSEYDTLTTVINFAHNNSHLFWFLYIPVDLGHVKAADIHFFGKPGQNDGVHMYAYYNTYMDLAFPDGDEDPSPPMGDEYYGGTNDAFCYLNYTSLYGSFFEGSKPLRSGDSAGKDIFLDYGQAIAVEIAAWINILPEDNGPNFGTMIPEEFRYIRLDIGDNLGDQLDIYGGPMYPGSVEGSEYQAPYIVKPIEIDGEANEAAWNDAMEYQLTLSYLNWSTGIIDTNLVWNITMLVCHDGVNMYFYFDLYDELESPGDWIGLVLGKGVDMLNYSEGTDFVMMGSYGYLDGYIPRGLGEPTADESVGGMNDGQANVTYTSTHRQVEFSKPLNSGDSVGKDWVFTAGDYMYITVVLAQNSEDGPNYFDLKDIDGKPYFVIHPVKLLKEGENPTDEGNGNTFTIGFSATDLLIITASITPIIAIVYLRRKK
ncbi:MAG: hypothetical protein HGN29_05245 [Asgard group archaeon]|nr:hypothetical protein [Asgard group archaeon]